MNPPATSDVQNYAEPRPTLRLAVKGKSFRRFPRVDANLYQAEIPELVGNDNPIGTRPGQLSAKDNCIWSPSVAEASEVDRFLLFGRNLVQQSSGMVPGSSSCFQWQSGDRKLVANEGDEAALEFLYKHSGDVELSEFYVASEVCAGTGYRSAEVLDAQRGSLPLSSWQAAYNKRVEPLGSLRCRDGYLARGYEYPVELTRGGAEPTSSEDEELEEPEPEQEPEPEPEPEPEEYEEGEEEGEDEGNSEDASVELASPVTVTPPMQQNQDQDRSRRGADRTASRNRWTALLERARHIQETAKKIRDWKVPDKEGKEPKLVVVWQGNDQRPTLEECIEILNEAASLPPPEQSPGEGYVEQAQSAIAAISDIVSETRAHAASILDVFHPDPEGNGRCGGGKFEAVSFAQLQGLRVLSDTVRARIKLTEMLTKILASAESWIRRSNGVLESLKVPVKAKAGLGKNLVHVSAVKALLDEAMTIPVKFEQTQALEEKLQAARVMDRVIHHQNGARRTQQGAITLAGTIRNAFPHGGRRSRPKPSLATARGLLEKVKVLGIDFPESRTIEKHLQSTQQWVARANAAMASQVGMREVQVLVTEAAALPIDPGTKLAGLQSKMDAALAWLEKVRKAVPKQRATRRNTPEMDNEKVDLTEVKSLLNQSSETGVDIDLKEFSHTSNLIESAEEWMCRVRDVLESGEAATLESLSSLLSEASNIPVKMEEEKLLTVGIKARRWRLRVNETLEGGRASLGALQRLAEEGARIREDFPEEAKGRRVYGVLDGSSLKELLDTGLDWKERAKVCLVDMQAGRPMDLERPLSLLRDAQMIKLDLSPEADSLQSAVQEVQEWFSSNKEMLSSLGFAGIEYFGCIHSPAGTSGSCFSSTFPTCSLDSSKGAVIKDSSPSDSDPSPCSLVPMSIEKPHEALSSTEMGTPGVKGRVKGEEDGPQDSGSGMRGLDGVHVPEPTPGRPRKVTYHDLSLCVYAVEKLALGRSLRWVRDMRALMHRVAEWIEQCQTLCPRRHSKRHVQPTTKPTFAQLEELINEGLEFPVYMGEEICRVREHRGVASRWQSNACLVLNRVTLALAEQAKRRMELWRQEDEGQAAAACSLGGSRRTDGLPTSLAASASREGVSCMSESGEGEGDVEEKVTDSRLSSDIGARVGGPHQGSLSTGTGIVGSTDRDSSGGREGIEGAECGHEGSENSVGMGHGEGKTAGKDREVEKGEGRGEEEEEAEVDPEEELDEAEDKNAEELTQLLEKAREINVFMPEELVAERVIEILLWSRKVRESVEEGLQLSQAKGIIKVGEGVCDLSTISMGKALEAAALTPPIVEALQTVIQCYKAKVQAIESKLEEAERWTLHAKDLMTKDHIKVEDLEAALASAQKVGVENEDLAKKMKAELSRGRGWLAKADAALHGKDKIVFTALKKLVAEGEKIKTCGMKLKEVKQQQKVAAKWLTRVKKTGIEKGTASIMELKALIPEATSIRCNLSEEVRVLKQATCSYCICNRPGDDQGYLVECRACSEGYHGTCMDISPEQAEALKHSEEGYKCIRCRISSLFEKAEQAMLTAMKNWMPATLFASQAGMEETLVPDEECRDRWQASQNFAALAGVVRDAMNLALKKIRTSLGVLSEVDNNIHALKTLPWNASPAGQVQHEQARAMLCNLRVLLWCTMAQWAVRRPPMVTLLYDLVSQGQQLTQVDQELLETLGSMTTRASVWEAEVRRAFRAPDHDPNSPINPQTLNKLLADAKGIPLQMPLEAKVVAAKEDGGLRYCLCRGPNDGTFMVCCDKCNGWFHGACVNIKEKNTKENPDFLCPACSQKKGVPYAYGAVDVRTLREQASATAPDIDDNQGPSEDDYAGTETGGNVCVWPPPAAKAFFDILDLNTLSNTDPSTIQAAPPEELERQHQQQQQLRSNMTTEEAYHYNANMEAAHTGMPMQNWRQVDSEMNHPGSQFTPTPYMAPATGSSSTGPAGQYGGGAGYHYHQPAGMDPFHPRQVDPYASPRSAGSGQSCGVEAYSYTMSAPMVAMDGMMAAPSGEGGSGGTAELSKKRTAEGEGADSVHVGSHGKRPRVDEA